MNPGCPPPKPRFPPAPHAFLLSLPVPNPDLNPAFRPKPRLGPWPQVFNLQALQLLSLPAQAMIISFCFLNLVMVRLGGQPVGPGRTFRYISPFAVLQVQYCH